METITIPINEYNELISFKKSILNIAKKESETNNSNKKTKYEEVSEEEQKEIKKLHFDILEDKFDRSEYIEL